MAEYYYDYQKDEVMVDTRTMPHYDKSVHAPQQQQNITEMGAGALDYYNQKQQAGYLPQGVNAAQATTGKPLADDTPNPIMLLAHHTFSYVLEILRRKNSDYASTADPFLNFRSAERIGLSVQQGIMMRLMDKMSRLENLVGKGAIPEVSDESVVDTCHDMIGYLVCLLAARNTIEEEKR